MKPLFTYQVPESSWYIVITDNSKHFYFNNEDKSSHWQLSDLQVEYGLDIPRFVDSINFDEIGLLMAKSRGVSFKKKEEVPKELPIDNTPKEEEIVIENIQQQEEPVQPKQKPKSILQGYSSSEEEESEDEHDINIDELTSQAIAEYQKPDEPASESEEEDNESLDLSVDEESTNTAEQDFINLLGRFSNKISIYDPWDLIEEELINEFSQNPEFFAISSKQERESIFQKWCSNQESTQNEITVPTILMKNYQISTIGSNY
ncbi:hypothetical protein G210_0177 [Candida maltosa Xu316]|uniref:WW domain-containing protein n=1 Tax=Candida maltosa (strain Xu316) TaxID=1245528 RepID=M3JAJ6_CANMX|nr:hypothetical protein G210_0177 [Candida maltosa Xu316]